MPHRVVPMKGDGSCLFYSISYILFGTHVLAHEVREQIVEYVVNNWERLTFISAMRNGNNYPCKEKYAAEMSLPETFGTTCELVAAAEIFSFKFIVYRDGATLAEFGEAINGEGKLRFSEELFGGHFDVLEELPNTSASEISEVSVYSSVSFSVTAMASKKNKRMKRVTNVTRNKQLRKANKKYSQNNPHINRKAVKKYSQNKPDINRTAVKKYSQNKPDINRTAVKKYTLNNPEVNKAAVKTYSKKRKTEKMMEWKIKYLSGFHYNADVDYADDKFVRLGKQTNVCMWCNAKKWIEESAGMCCNNGKVQLPFYERLPELLSTLLKDEHPDSANFLNEIRKYNACFQMTSFGAKEVKEGNYMPSFKIQGQIYHRIGSLLSSPEQQPRYLQIYFVGNGDNERDIRCGYFLSVKPALISQLQSMLHSTNSYIKEFKAAINSVTQEQSFQVVIVADKKPFDGHRGRFNAPTAREVAIVIEGQEFGKRDIVLQSRDDKLLRICETHRAYDALQYPLMFCHGEDGYSINIPQIDPITQIPLKKTVSAAAFYAYRIMEREDQENHLLYFRNLLNQFLVDMYAKIETERLNYIRNNQAKLRVETYVHLQDAIRNSDAQVSDLGKMVILPSSFTGGPRYLHERTQDAMTYVRHYGKPDLFITFTCNPKWVEISEHLFGKQNASHRHDLIVRVFHLKVKKIMYLLTKGKIFGTVRCHMFSVEWQKRGLPHVHILLWLKEKITANQIDDIIRAEIPDRDKEPALYEIVKSNMIHGPCGLINKKSPCMVNGSCIKRYPRPLTTDTQTGDDGYPQYRRRSPDDGGFTVNVNDIELDNRWVVPYNPVLSCTFNAHINVEFCSSVKSIKYICKYINKGSDQAVFAFQNEHDEVTTYKSGRYISSSEAVWRILCFPVHERFPPVMHLAVHLENGQRVYFSSDNVADKLTNPPKTTLIAFFELCKRDDFAKELLYYEVPSYFVWKNNMFSRRKQGEDVPGHPGVKKDPTLGRVYTIHPNNAECYYLRMLLHEVRGPTSFAELKKVDGHVHPTFQSACRALGLLEDDDHWDHTLSDAAISHSPYKLRELFAIMLVYCQLSNPLLLWEKHKNSLSEDVTRHLQKEFQNLVVQEKMDEIYNRSLVLLEDIVVGMTGQPLKYYGLTEPSRFNEVNINRDYLNEVSYNTESLCNIVLSNEPLLNCEQKEVYSTILHSVETNNGVFFLDAPGGTGKTFLINLLLAKVRQNRNIAIAVASSGIAATLLEGGKTAHSAFKLPLNLNFTDAPLCNISKQSNMAQVLRDCKLIVWDECTMSHKEGIEALDRTLQDIRNNSMTMGGVTVLFAGDFRQTLPVVPRGTRADEVKACLKSSYLWPKIKILSLRKNMRVHLNNDFPVEEYSALLLKIGDGKMEYKEGKVEITDSLCDLVTDMQTLIRMIYPDVENMIKSVSWLKERAILTPKNEKANEINSLMLQKLATFQITYDSIDSVVQVEDAVHYPVEFLHTLNPPGMPPHRLTLKIGVPIMLLRNLNPPKMCNGTRLQIKALHKNLIEATIFTGCGQGESVFIPRIPLIPSAYPFEFRRLQFPIKVCFAMTINKAQGQSLKKCGVDLRDDCFSHGQLYVACSRVSSPRSLAILQPEGKTANVVYKEVLI